MMTTLNRPDKPTPKIKINNVEGYFLEDIAKWLNNSEYASFLVSFDSDRLIEYEGNTIVPKYVFDKFLEGIEKAF